MNASFKNKNIFVEVSKVWPSSFIKKMMTIKFKFSTSSLFDTCNLTGVADRSFCLGNCLINPQWSCRKTFNLCLEAILYHFAYSLNPCSARLIQS